jgi:hypothetical protein
MFKPAIYSRNFAWIAPRVVALILLLSCLGAPRLSTAFPIQDSGQIGYYSYYSYPGSGAPLGQLDAAYAIPAINYFGFRGYRYLGGNYLSTIGSIYLGGSALYQAAGAPPVRDLFEANLSNRAEQYWYYFGPTNPALPAQQALAAWNYFGAYGYQPRAVTEFGNVIGTLYEKHVRADLSNTSYYYYAVPENPNYSLLDVQNVLRYFGAYGYRYLGPRWFSDGPYDVFERNGANPLYYYYSAQPADLSSDPYTAISRWNLSGFGHFKALGRFQIGSQRVDLFEYDTRNLFYYYTYLPNVASADPDRSTSNWNFYGSYYYRALGSAVFGHQIVDLFEETYP